MPESELVDVFTHEGQPAGTVARAVAHRDGLWHKVLHCWVASPEFGGCLLFQRRALDKAHWPGLLDITAAGHLLAGETWQAALRETEEEIGLTVHEADVVDAGERLEQLQVGVMVNREFCRTVLLRSDRSLADYRIGPEVLELVAVPLRDGAQLFSGVVDVISCPALGAEGVCDVPVRAEHAIERPAEYYLDMLALAGALLRGERHLRAADAT